MFKVQKPQDCKDVNSPMLIYELKCNPNKKSHWVLENLKPIVKFVQKWKKRKTTKMDFPGGPGVKTLPSNADGVGLIPGFHMPKKKKKSHKKTQKQCCHKSNKDFKNGPHQKLWCWKSL